MYIGGKEREKNRTIIRAAHGRVAPEGVNEKMLTIRSHQHQPRHEDGGDGRSLLEKVIWKSTLCFCFRRTDSAEKRFFSAVRGLQKEGR